MKAKPKKTNFLPIIVLFILLLAFILLKLPTINTPLYQDEISLVMDGIKLSDNNFNLIKQPYWYGHVPLTVILLSLLIKIFGFHVFLPHIISIISGAFSLVFFYLICRKFTKISDSLLATAMLAATPLFFTQAGILNLDMPVNALILVMLYFYLSEKKKLFILFSCLAVMAKEPAIIILSLIILFDFIKNRISLMQYLKKNYTYALPFLLLVSWLIFCRISYGWFFTPIHKSFFFLDKAHFYQSFHFIFLENYSFLIFPLFIIGLIKERKYSFLLISIILATTAFFGTNLLRRYLLIIIPFYYLLLVISIKDIKFREIYYIILIILFSTIIYPKTNYLSPGEEWDMDYLSIINLDKSGWKYIDKQYPEKELLLLWPHNYQSDPRYGYTNLTHKIKVYQEVKDLENPKLPEVAMSCTLEDSINKPAFRQYLDKYYKKVVSFAKEGQELDIYVLNQD